MPRKPASTSTRTARSSTSARAKPAGKAKATKAPAATGSKPASVAASDAGAMPWAPDAVGLARVRAGFGKTSEDDTLFALGYPHIVVPTDTPEPKGARDPSKTWKLFPRKHVTHVPRSLLPYVYGYHDAPTNAAALFAGPPPTYDVKTEMKTMFRSDDRMMFLLEAMHGSEAVASAAVDVLCACPVAAWKHRDLDESGWNGIRNLGYVLLRVSPATHARLRTRLEALFKKVSSAQGKDWWRPVQALDVILHGRAGVERSGDGGWFDLAQARDDGAWVAARALADLKKLKPADRALFDSQIAFVGGAKVATAMRDLKPFFSELHRDAKQQLARIA